MDVTPFAGVWIEITDMPDICFWEYVTPFAGVWIEIALLRGRFEVRGVTPISANLSKQSW